ncbi:hypothetical protein [Afipia carboxidovorans]|uniref:hypothetical protein n=1 Tax=Afipia carboxidovorans TaxID=40137 RepID=UPI001FCBECF0|nr:hypothetical protein [Afipia carboxidovorans]
MALAAELDAMASEKTLKCWEPRHGAWMMKMREAASALRHAAQSQEPVAWRWRYEGESNWSLRKDCPSHASDHDVQCEPLYTAPPQSASDGALLEAAAKIASTYDGVNFPPAHRHANIIAQAIRALAASEATKSDGGALPTNLAEIIELELMAWRGANGGVYTIRAAALGVSCAIRSAVFRAINTSSDGGHGGQPYASTDAVEGASAPNAISGKQEGRTGHER